MSIALAQTPKAPAVRGAASLTADLTLDWERGEARYRVSGPRVTGTFTLTATAHGVEEGDPAAHTLPQIEFGVRPEGRYHCPPDEYLDRPVINGVDLCGGVTVAGWRDQESSPWGRDWWYLRRADWREVPEATRRRTAEICRLLIASWQALPEWHALVRARLAHLAPEQIKNLTREIGRLQREVDERAAALARYQQHVGAWHLITANPRLLLPSQDTQ